MSKTEDHLKRKWYSGWERIPESRNGYWVVSGTPEGACEGTIRTRVRKMPMREAFECLYQDAIAATPVLDFEALAPIYITPQIPRAGQVWEDNEDSSDQVVIIGISYECYVVWRGRDPSVIGVDNLQWFITEHHLVECVTEPIWAEEQ